MAECTGLPDVSKMAPDGWDGAEASAAGWAALSSGSIVGGRAGDDGLMMGTVAIERAALNAASARASAVGAGFDTAAASEGPAELASVEQVAPE